MKTVFRSLSRTEVDAIANRHDSDEALQHALAELLHLREQRDRLQASNTALVEQLRASTGILTLLWKRIGEHKLAVPRRANPGDAGVDLPIALDGVPSLNIYPDKTIVFRTGWAVEIPHGWYGQIVVRSSVGKAGWDLESSGVIDSGYRGEIMMPMIYRGEAPVTVEHGKCMAQMLVLPVPHVESVEVASLSDTVRGAGGFGSTGR